MEISLFQLKNNKQAKVVDVVGGFGLRQRLEGLGIKVGSRILKISDVSGPVVIKVKGAQLAIGRGMASKIIVEEE